MIILETVAVAFSMFSAIPMPHVDWNEKNWDPNLMESIKNLIHLKRTEKILGYGNVSISSKNDVLIVKRSYMEQTR